MDKRIIIGILAGIVFGLIGTFVLEEGGFNATYFVIVAILGALIGFASTKPLPINFYAASAIIGAIFYMVIAATHSAGFEAVVVDQLVTGLVAGGLIGIITDQLHKRMG